jgi:hypothetical protein
MKKLLVAILKNESPECHLRWEKACQDRAQIINWEVVDLTRADWLEQIIEKPYDGLLAIPSGLTNHFKQLYDERVRILNTVLNIPLYPSLREIEIYENKRYLSYWLAAMGVPHPQTWVFYYPEEALDFVAQAGLPLVGKTNIGSSGRGVCILHNRAEALTYVNNTFYGKGAYRTIGPRWQKRDLFAKLIEKLSHPGQIKAKLKKYHYQHTDAQRTYVILQQFVPHSFEWRCVRIGDSFFAHKKLVKGEKASGTLLKAYDNPPLELLEFVRGLTDQHQLSSLAVDLFESVNGSFLVNEMQCIFGQSDPYQMLVDGQMGRYRYLDGTWVFEAGDFNRYESFLLRLDHFIGLLSAARVKPISRHELS